MFIGLLVVVCYAAANSTLLTEEGQTVSKISQFVLLPILARYDVKYDDPEADKIE